MARPIAVYFYGLFMDVDLLRGKGARPENVRLASLPDYALRIGARATLIPQPGARVYGVLLDLTHAELDALYADPAVSLHRPEAVIAESSGGDRIPALCYVLPTAPGIDERNAEYAARLRELATNLRLPAEYVATIA